EHLLVVNIVIVVIFLFIPVEIKYMIVESNLLSQDTCLYLPSSTVHNRLQQQLLFFNFDRKNVVFKGHSLHFSRPKFALLPVGLVVTNLDVLGVIEDEVMLGNLCDDGSVRLCLILALEVIFIGRLLTCPVDDSLFGLVENLEACNVFPWGEHVWTQLYDSIKNVVVKHSDTHYLGLKKDRNYVPTYTLTGFVFAFQVLVLERNDKLERLQFNEDLSRLIGDFVESLNILFQDLVDPHDSVEDIANEYLVDEELKLCLKEEERICSEQEKRIQQEKRLRLEEEKMLRLEQMLEMQSFLHVSTSLVESYKLLEELQDFELEKCKDLMKSISETQLKECFPVILEGAKVFDKKGIHPGDYTISFKLANNVPKQGGEIKSLRTMLSLKLTMVVFSIYVIFEVIYDGVFNLYPLRYDHGKILTLKLSKSMRMSFSKLLDMLSYKMECEIWGIFYSTPRSILEEGLTIVGDNFDMNKMYDMRKSLHDNWLYKGLSLDGPIDVGGQVYSVPLDFIGANLQVVLKKNKGRSMAKVTRKRKHQYYKKINMFKKVRGKRVSIEAGKGRLGGLVALNDHEVDDDPQLKSQV
nr:phospholipase-like protein [Tanacetum cinerariifolium]